MAAASAKPANRAASNAISKKSAIPKIKPTQRTDERTNPRQVRRNHPHRNFRVAIPALARHFLSQETPAERRTEARRFHSQHYRDQRNILFAAIAGKLPSV